MAAAAAKDPARVIPAWAQRRVGAIAMELGFCGPSLVKKQVNDAFGAFCGTTKDHLLAVGIAEGECWMLLAEGEDRLPNKAYRGVKECVKVKDNMFTVTHGAGVFTYTVHNGGFSCDEWVESISLRINEAPAAMKAHLKAKADAIAAAKAATGAGQKRGRPDAGEEAEGSKRHGVDSSPPSQAPAAPPSVATLALRRSAKKPSNAPYSVFISYSCEYTHLPFPRLPLYPTAHHNSFRSLHLYCPASPTPF